MVANSKSYLKGFVPFGLAAAFVSLSGGFTASIPTNIVTAWGAESIYTTWITLAYSMGAAACAPVLGKLGDLFGRRITALGGLAAMLIGLLVIALAPTGAIWLVLVGRFVVGSGAAAITPTVIAYITSEFPAEKSGQGFTIYMGIASVMVIFGPTIGGLILQVSSYQVVLLICAVIAALVFLVGFFLFQKNPAPKQGFGDFDIVGGTLIILFFSLALCVPTLGQNLGWAATSTLIITGLTVVALVLLVLAERKAKQPILLGKFMARKTFILPVIVLFLTQGLLQACMTNTIYFANMIAPGTTIANYATSIMYVGMTLGTLLLGPLSDKREPRYVSVVALLFCALGTALQLLYTENSGFVTYAVSLFFIGLGLGGNVTIFMKVVLSGLEPAIAGAGSGTYTVFSNLAAPFGVAIFVPMFTQGFANLQAADSGFISGVVSSMHTVAIIQVVCVVVGIVVCLMLPKIHPNKAAKAEVAAK